MRKNLLAPQALASRMVAREAPHLGQPVRETRDRFELLPLLALAVVVVVARGGCRGSGTGACRPGRSLRHAPSPKGSWLSWRPSSLAAPSGPLSWTGPATRAPDHPCRGSGRRTHPPSTPAAGCPCRTERAYPCRRLSEEGPTRKAESFTDAPFGPATPRSSGLSPRGSGCRGVRR